MKVGTDQDIFFRKNNIYGWSMQAENHQRNLESRQKHLAEGWGELQFMDIHGRFTNNSGAYDIIWLNLTMKWIETVDFPERFEYQRVKN